MRLSDCRGQWALVTGASSGIGAEYCRQLAKAGAHLVMVARRREPMEALSASLVAEHGVRTLVIGADLAQTGGAALVKAQTDAAGIAVRLLVNNAASGPWGRFEHTDARALEDLVHLSTATPIALCRLYADALKAHRGACINVSSPAALQPVPFMAAYAAAKSCLHQFSLALHHEWATAGITVQTVLPAPTATDFDAKGGAYGSALGARRLPAADIVAASLAALEKGDPIVTNSGKVPLQRAFAGLAPIRLLLGKVGQMFTPPPGR